MALYNFEAFLKAQEQDAKEQAAKERENKIFQLATRIKDLSDPYELADTDSTVFTISNDIDKDPIAVIEYLVDLYERLARDG